MPRTWKSVLAILTVVLVTLTGCAQLKGPQGPTGDNPSLLNNAPDQLFRASPA
jgi:predicted small lipoprotein YifL